MIFGAESAARALGAVETRRHLRHAKRSELGKLPPSVGRHVKAVRSHSPTDFYDAAVERATKTYEHPVTQKARSGGATAARVAGRRLADANRWISRY